MSSGLNYILSVSDVFDRAPTPNQIAPDSAKTFVYIEYGIAINFQPANAPVPNGYLVDAGHVFGNRGNGYSYGWNANNTGSARDRNSIDEQIWDTFNHMRRQGEFSWEIALPNGWYYIHLGSFDPNFTEDSAIFGEGEQVLSGNTASEGRLEVRDMAVQVEDGRLSITAPSDNTFSKINFIRIATASAGVSGRRVDIRVDTDQGAMEIEVEADAEVISGHPLDIILGLNPAVDAGITFVKGATN